MLSILRDLRYTIRADFRPDLYAATTGWAIFLLAVNYWLDLEDSYIDSFQGDPRWPVLYFLLYATVYYGSVGTWAYYCKQTAIWHNRDFWLRSGVALTCYSIYSGFYAHSNWSRQLYDGQIYVFAYYCLHNLQSLLTIVTPLYIFYRIVDQPRDQLSNFYGMMPKRKGLVLYVVLLALMIPLITVASFQPDFLAAYPTYHDTNANEFFGVPEWVTALIYELCYGWDFVPTELLFRGFLVIGMSRILGSGAILPMVIWYCSIHFGRPLAEAVSSIVGGAATYWVCYPIEPVVSGEAC